MSIELETPIKILVKRRAALGDVVMTTGLVREIFKHYRGNVSITMETDFGLVYKNNPYITDLKNWGQCRPVDYDVVYNLDDAYELNPKNHFVDSMFYRVFGIDMFTKNRAPDLHADSYDRNTVDHDLESFGSFFAVHMRQWYWPLKNITIETWQDILEQVFEQHSDHKLLCVGGSTDLVLDHPLAIDVRSRYTPQQLAYLFNKAKCFVGIDSAPFQIAGASDTHIIALLTHNPPEYIMPQRHFDPTWNWTAVQASIDCVGCNVRQIRPIREIACEKNDFPCNRSWNTAHIAKVIIEQLKKN